MRILPIKATLLSPLSYGSVAIPAGTATLSQALGDQALCFALCAALGMLKNSPVLRENPKYKEDLQAMPWRASLLWAKSVSLLPPLVRRSDLGVEGGKHKRFEDAAGSGNFKEFFVIQEIAPHSVFQGALFVKENPFEIASSEKIVVRMGNTRTGQVLLEPDETVESVRLNAATAARFGREEVAVEKFLLGNIQATKMLPLTVAQEEVRTWFP